MENNPIVTITMEDGGKIVAELYPDIAPQSVRNFIYRSSIGYFKLIIPFVFDIIHMFSNPCTDSC